MAKDKPRREPRKPKKKTGTTTKAPAAVEPTVRRTAST
jgi:hypothetical protein